MRPVSHDTSEPVMRVAGDRRHTITKTPCTKHAESHPSSMLQQCPTLRHPKAGTPERENPGEPEAVPGVRCGGWDSIIVRNTLSSRARKH